MISQDVKGRREPEDNLGDMLNCETKTNQQDAQVTQEFYVLLDIPELPDVHKHIEMIREARSGFEEWLSKHDPQAELMPKADVPLLMPSYLVRGAKRETLELLTQGVAGVLRVWSADGGGPVSLF